ncbi:Fur family transcriptional regulator [Polycladidibacter hongkongensis]|uniref:Fur family transcriptional regulator n=1 Tax=Polycladidibacter hongkongensis TaxID=1647556 RepID=UPI00082B12DE|nr:Fur family transcriptional regulator [Pseudovibrio hongkongensis]
MSQCEAHGHVKRSEPSLTKNQQLVWDVLRHASAPMSAYAILDEVRADGLRAPQQVYRALDKLVDTSLVHKLESLNAFVACAQPCCAEHEMVCFAICEACGSVDEFADDQIEQQFAEWTKRSGFVRRQTAVEIKGLCKGCAAQA